MSDYKKQIARVKAGIDKLGDNMLAQTSWAVQRHVALNTPVKTGRARSNWLMSINSPDRNTTEDTTMRNLAEGAATAQKIKGDDTVYISNNLPYIERLNDGYSKQQPEPFVESSAQIARQQVREIAAKGLPKP